MDETRIVPVNVRTMRHVYRDIISASSAGESIYEVLASIASVARLDVHTLAWTGDPEAPVAIRLEESWGDESTRRLRSAGRTWWRFAKGSRMARMVAAEYQAYYPDAHRNYSSMVEFGRTAYKLVIGTHLVSVVFDENNQFARLPQQRNSLLDLITQSLLDYYRRMIRHYQDQITFSVGPVSTGHTTADNQMDLDVRSFTGDSDAAAREALELLERNARVMADFFDIVYVEFLMAPDISKLVMVRQVLATTEYEGHVYHKVMLAVGAWEGSCCIDDEEGVQGLQVLDFPMPWGSNNEDDRFVIRLYSHREMNAHVRKSLMLGQVMIKCKEHIEALFDRRYREHRIYQDNRHFERCKVVRNQASSLDDIRQHLRDSVAEYEESARTLKRSLILPRFEAWSERLSLVLKNLDSDILEFRDEIRLRDLREYRYLNMKVPQDLRAILLRAMDPDVHILVESEHPGLARMTDFPEHGDQSHYVKKQVFFNSAATVYVLYPKEPAFRFARLRAKFTEYLESVGEGFGKIFSFINTQTGVKNRLALVQSLEFFVHQVGYSNLVNLEVSSLDIASFKIFNELFGHPFGDRVIRYTAHRLDECSPGFAFHVSGDEYYIVHCYHEETNEAWMRDFFASKEIIPIEQWRSFRSQLEDFTYGIKVKVPFSDVADEVIREPTALGTYRLVDFLGNFFTRDVTGQVTLKKYSRTGNDYQNVIFDPDGKIQDLVDLVWDAICQGKIVWGEESFASFVLRHNNLGDHIHVLPTMTIGTVSYNSATILPYVSDIVDAADAAAGKNKK